jgi:cysteine dioxygenase
MPHALRATIEDFVEGLKSFEREMITKDAVRSYMEQVHLSAAALKPYTFFRDSYYTRNLIYRDNLFEVMAICWKPGQKTVIHTHDGQLGWMTVPQGEVAVHNYKYFTCNKPENQNVVGHDCLAGATHIELDRLQTEVVADSSPIYCVDKFQTIHQIENMDKSDVGVVSLHVYSLPIESCVAFDLEHQRCSRKTLSFYSRYGKVELETDAAGHTPLPIIA